MQRSFLIFISMVNIKIQTANVRGLLNYGKRRDLFYNYRKSRYDIIFLQETHSEKKIEKMWSTQWGSKIWFSHGTNLARGVAVLFAKNFQYQVHNVISDDHGRYLLVYCTVNDKHFLLTNIYAPNDDDKQFMTQFAGEVSHFSLNFYIIGGDFNLVMDLAVDKQGGKNITHTKARKVL